MTKETVQTSVGSLGDALSLIKIIVRSLVEKNRNYLFPATKVCQNVESNLTTSSSTETINNVRDIDAAWLSVLGVGEAVSRN